MRWKNRCPAVIYAEVNGRQQVIDRCYYEADEEHRHWSKNTSERGPWVIPAYNPYVASWLAIYWPFDIPKMKPNVGYWPRSASTSKGQLGMDCRWWRFQRLMFQGMNESEARLYLEEMKEEYAYRLHQQQMVDDFRAKLHFADRIVMP